MRNFKCFSCHLCEKSCIRQVLHFLHWAWKSNVFWCFSVSCCFFCPSTLKTWQTYDRILNYGQIRCRNFTTNSQLLTPQVGEGLDNKVYTMCHTMYTFHVWWKIYFYLVLHHFYYPRTWKSKKINKVLKHVKLKHIIYNEKINFHQSFHQLLDNILENWIF